MCPREHLQKHVPLITWSALAKRTPSLLVALTWQLWQLYGAAVLTNTPGELQLTASCAVKSPRCDLFCNLTGAEESCNEFSIKILQLRVRAMFKSDKVVVKMNLLYPEDRKREISLDCLQFVSLSLHKESSVLHWPRATYKECCVRCRAED